MADRKTKPEKQDGRKRNGGARPKQGGDEHDRRGGGTALEQPHGGRIGQEPHVPTPEQREIVETYGVVLTQPMLADYMGISHSTLLRHYRAELNRALAKAAATVGSKTYAQALAGHFPSQRLFLTTRCGWSQHHTVTGPGGGPVQHQEVDQWAEFLASLPEDEYERIRERWEQYQGNRDALPDGRDVQEGGDPPA